MPRKPVDPLASIRKKFKDRIKGIPRAMRKIDPDSENYGVFLSVNQMKAVITATDWMKR